ncbi:MAG: inositol monophosphatase family protein [Bdellovibrionales bacterium]
MLDQTFPQIVFDPVATLIIKIAEEVILPIYRRPNMHVEIKADHTPVTEADGKAEAALRKELAEMFPGAGFIGEETDGGDWRESPLLHEENGLWVPDRSRKVFIMDPVDGTINFAMGPKVGRRFATMLAMFDHGEFAASWIYYPLTREFLFTTPKAPSYLIGIDPNGAIEPPRVAHVQASRKRPLNMEYLIYGLLKDPERHKAEGSRMFGALIEPNGRMEIMTCIAECLYNMVVTGELDLAVSPFYTTPWDFWTTGPAFENAGAVAMNESSHNYRACATRGSVIANAPELAVKTCEIIAGLPRG